MNITEIINVTLSRRAQWYPEVSLLVLMVLAENHGMMSREEITHRISGCVVTINTTIRELVRNGLINKIIDKGNHHFKLNKAGEAKLVSILKQPK